MYLVELQAELLGFIFGSVRARRHGCGLRYGEYVKYTRLRYASCFSEWIC